ncbi:hypothetical protein SAMN04488072_11049 [Lentibacillus halodurans]|uniref:Uncharacterized protein n=1 Tax=Lentibacillus halodurans TaxID=237679 RepID=A0A1I0Z841_9BACI|nr:hypothetical protein [Lentibacillus halodurans]SFB21919.1 hypothetical protein SAMN04488072_11049 [Lentibacillus halodurans]
MSQRSFFSKIAIDMFTLQMKWTLWFLFFVALAHIIFIFINSGNSMMDFMAFSHGSAKIYMLVIGLLSVYAFLTYYVHHGLTRKDYFIGSAISAAGIALVMTFAVTLLTGLEYPFWE